MRKREPCRFRQAFFSLNSNYIQHTYENMMILIWRGGWNYSDLYNMSITKRNWLFDTFASLNQQRQEPSEEEVE